MLLENLLWKTPDDHADFAKLKGISFLLYHTFVLMRYSSSVGITFLYNKHITVSTVYHTRDEVILVLSLEGQYHNLFSHTCTFITEENEVIFSNYYLNSFPMNAKSLPKLRYKNKPRITYLLMAADIFLLLAFYHNILSLF